MNGRRSRRRALDLWEHVFGGEARRGFVGLFSGFRSAPGEKILDATRSSFFRYPDECHEVREWMLTEDGRGREVYFCAHLLGARRRIKDNASPLSALYVDGDGAKPIGPSTPAPTAVVESSPGREQFYWRLSRLVAPKVGESLNRRLALAMGGDRSGWDLTQLLRPPGTHNHKYSDAPLVVLREITDAAYDPDELDRLLPLVPEEPEARRARPTGTPTGGVALDDAELLRRARASANGEKFARLWDGDTSDYANGDNEGRSEADLALCSMVAFWTGPDEARIDGLFRQSGLMRPKWDERRYGDGRTYGQGTIKHALAGRTEFWEPRRPSRSKARRIYKRAAHA